MLNEPLIHRIQEITGRRKLPNSDELDGSLDRVLGILDNEVPDLRPPDSSGVPGGLVLLKDLPTIIVPDLHAREGYFAALLAWTPPGMDLPVYRGLREGRIQVVCVGDGFHSEARGRERWQEAYREFSGGYRKHRAMDAEMKESLGVMQLVMELKAAFPEMFHFLKGNHENVANEFSPENRPFRKFVSEGAMVVEWFQRFRDLDFFQAYYRFEKRLPVFAVGNRFCITHAEPRRHYTRDEVIDARIRPEIIFDLTWTADDEAEQGSVASYLEEYFPGDPVARMFGGHRPVRGRFNGRAAGRYIQIHNPNLYVAAFIDDMVQFTPETSIVVLPSRGA